MKIVDIFFTTLQEQWLKQRLDLEQRYPHEIVPLSSFSWNFYKPLMQGYFITFLGCDKLITETVIRVVHEEIKTFEIAVDSLWFVYVSLFSLAWVIRTSEAKWLSVTPKRGEPLSFFFFFLFCFVYLIFHSTISEALVFEGVIKLIGEQKLAKQRLQKKCFTALVWIRIKESITVEGG